MSRWARAMTRVLPALLVAWVVGCGSEAGTSDDTPAAEVPPDTAVDAEVPGSPAQAPAGGAEGAEGTTLHALGQEPGWMVDITPGGEMRVLAQYGTDTISAPAPTPTPSPDGGRVYRITTAEHTVALTVTDEPCRDAMSGKPFPMTVTLELDGEVFRGCGRRGDAE